MWKLVAEYYLHIIVDLVFKSFSASSLGNCKNVSILISVLDWSIQYVSRELVIHTAYKYYIIPLMTIQVSNTLYLVSIKIRDSINLMTKQHIFSFTQSKNFWNSKRFINKSFDVISRSCNYLLLYIWYSHDSKKSTSFSVIIFKTIIMIIKLFFTSVTWW